MTTPKKPASKAARPAAKKEDAPKKKTIAQKAATVKKEAAKPVENAVPVTVKTRLHPSAPWPFPTGKRP